MSRWILPNDCGPAWIVAVGTEHTTDERAEARPVFEMDRSRIVHAAVLDESGGERRRSWSAVNFSMTTIGLPQFGHGHLSLCG